MPKDGFIVALAHARQRGHDSFIDPETLTTIELDRNWDPERISMLKRKDRLDRQASAGVWWRRALRWFRELGLDRAHADD